MRQFLRLFAVFVVLTLSLAGCEPSVPQGTGEGQKALDIEGRDVDGKTIRLADFQGKIVLIDVWATWCAPCVGLIPHERELANLYKGRPFAILGVSQDYTADALREFLAQNKLPWPNIYDDSRDFAKAWGIEVLPSFIVIDEKGIVRDRWRGGSSMHEIEKLVEKLVRTLEQR